MQEALNGALLASRSRTSRSGGLAIECSRRKALPADTVRLRAVTKLAALLKDFGERVQYSVFECLVDDDALDRLRRKVEAKVVADEDSVRIYRFCAECREKVEILGRGGVTEDPEVYVL